MSNLLVQALIIIIVTIAAVVISDRSGLNAKCDGWASPLIGLVGVAVLASLFL